MMMLMKFFSERNLDCPKKRPDFQHSLIGCKFGM